MTKGTILNCAVTYMSVPLEVVGTYFKGLPANELNPPDPSEFEISEVFISIDGHRVKGDDFLDNVSNLRRRKDLPDEWWIEEEVDSWKDVEELCIKQIENGLF